MNLDSNLLTNTGISYERPGYAEAVKRVYLRFTPASSATLAKKGTTNFGFSEMLYFNNVVHERQPLNCM